ncbi:alpha-ketoglutarate-dependent dioxygenase AlkB family protein [Pseudaestuariivita sp.]|uniref:alpha-ketoglutarate-dependent dioxygenase AlkB family protein n=1 Tax=Pseudaestuariivita sp. TaxID=2211669 RepID=UPI004058C187
MTPMDLRGVRVFPGFLDRAAQERMLEDVRAVARAAPVFHPVTPSGRKMSVRMTSAGQFGWVTDRKGYRYEPRHPDGQPWPAIPASIREVWDAVSGWDGAPECCLVNFYGESAKMGMHQDKDEADFAAPVVSISLGDDALFRVGGTERKGSTESVWLKSGDVVVMGGAVRLCYHGVDRIRFGTSTLLKDCGRINLTLRVVT